MSHAGGVDAGRIANRRRGMSIWLLVLAHVGVCVWLIWFRGAETMDGSLKTLFFFRPGMTATELRFWAGVSFFLIPIYVFFI